MAYKLNDALGYLVNIVAGRYKNEIYSVLAPYDLTPEQWIVLNRLWEGDGKTQRELAIETFKDEPNIARILQKLECKAYVHRCADCKDRRIMLVYITETGKCVAEAALPVIFDYQKRMTKRLSDSEVLLLKGLLKKLMGN
ncbi:MAG: transcriptional regulator [Firmicutes bacterium]|nr:transcriptional regulator [Bacillota bacterium]